VKQSGWSSIESLANVLSQQMHMASLENNGYSSSILIASCLPGFTYAHDLRPHKLQERCINRLWSKFNEV